MSWRRRLSTTPGSRSTSLGASWYAFTSPVPRLFLDQCASMPILNNSGLAWRLFSPRAILLSQLLQRLIGNLVALITSSLPIILASVSPSFIAASSIRCFRRCISRVFEHADRVCSSRDYANRLISSLITPVSSPINYGMIFPEDCIRHMDGRNAY